MMRDTRGRGGRPANRGSWSELAVFFLMIAGVYLVLAVLNSPWAGQSGRLMGDALRVTWGGAAFVPLCFWVYLCVARLIRFRVPRPLGQLLGTAQLYLSLAFMLGLARYAGWDPGWALCEPGRVGMGLAQFFVLNLGALGTLLAAVASFLLAALLFRSRLLMRLLFSAGAAEQRADEPQRREAPAPKPEPAVFAPPLPSVPAPEPEDTLRVRRSPRVPFDPLAAQGLIPPEAPSEAPAETPPVQDAAPVPQEPETPSLDALNETLDEALAEALSVPEPPVPEVHDVPDLPAPPVPVEPRAETGDAGVGLKPLLTELPPSDWRAPGPDTTASPKVDKKEKTALEILDDLLSSLEAGAFAPAAPVERTERAEAGAPVRRERRGVHRPPLASEEEPPAPPEIPEPVEDVPLDTALDVPLDAPLTEEPLMEEPVEAESRPRQGVFPPPLDIFGPPAEDEGDREAMEAAKGQGEVIIETLRDFGVNASVAHIVMGPSVVQFQLELAPGTKVNKVSGLANELTMALAVVSVRVEAPIPGQHYVGVEIPNSRRRGIPLRSAMESEEMRECGALLPLPMGMQVDSRFLVCGLEEMPHLLVAGTTGSGKSVFVNACILGMCSRRAPDELRLILVDPKHVEFAIYEGLPHLLARPVSDPRKAIDALAWAVQEMEARMESFARAHVRNLASYNDKVLPKDRYPSIVVVVDELADLMYTAGKEVEGLIVRLAQKARAAGIHLILATQRPSVDVITGLIKANVPARVAFAVPSQTDSRTIIDTAGADKLLGKGDMLFLSTRHPRPVRLQSPFITEERTLDFVEYLKGAFGEPEYIEFADSGGGSGDGGRGGNGAVDDPKMEEAIRVVMEMGITSASGLQRILSIGYPKAGRLIAAMEQLGILGPQTPNSTKPRDILMDEESAYEALERARTGELFDGE